MPQPDWEELERRVARLERLVGVEEERPAAKSWERPAELTTPSVNVNTLLPILGRALLGLAGAYLLRALTESDSVPRAAGVACGILYAVLWLLWAARSPAFDPLPAAIRSLTSALVFYPLLWEATVHFQAVPDWLGAGLLAGFVLLGIAVSWRRKLPIVSTIVTLGGLIAAAGLLLATRDVVPFTMLFLLVAAATETSTCMEHRLNQRWLAAAGADLAVWLATWLVAREHGLPDGYAAIPNSLLLGMQAALVGIYLASAIVRTLVRGLTFTWFETAQSAIVLLIGVGGGFWLSGDAAAIAGFALACATACYSVSFVVLDRAGNHGRNFYTYSSFGFLLLLTGSRALLHGMAAYALWCVLAMGCVWAGVRFGPVTLQVHGGIYLLLALAGSGGLTQVAGIALGSGTWSSAAPLVLTFGTVSAGLCYWMASRNRDAEQILSQLLAGVFIWMLAGLSTGAVAIACCAMLDTGGGEAYSATLRTCSLVLLSLLLAWTGVRWNRPELSRLIYPAMILGAYRLVAVDFNQNRKLPLFLSLLAYGAVLIALPRLTRSPASSIS